MSKDDHVGNVKTLGRFLTKKTFSKLGKSWSANDWTNSLAQVVKVDNAYYRPDLNQFVLPAGFMYQFLFDIDQPMYLNFASNGMTIGHEILHGFDNDGRNWDKKGGFNDINNIQTKLQFSIYSYYLKLYLYLNRMFRN